MGFGGFLKKAVGGIGPLGVFSGLSGLGGPSAPDPNSLVNSQLSLAQRVQGLNAPPQTGYFGSTSYDYGPNGEIRGIKNTLSPEMLALKNSLLGSLGTRPNDVSDALYGQYTSRLDPQWKDRQTMLDDQLANQGIPLGSEAYSAAHRDFDFGRNDAYDQARRDATLAGGQEQSRLLQGLFGLGNAGTAGYQGVPQIGTPDLMGAQMNAYNQKQAGHNNLLSGLFGLGGSILGGPIGGVIGSQVPNLLGSTGGGGGGSDVLNLTAGWNPIFGQNG